MTDNLDAVHPAESPVLWVRLAATLRTQIEKGDLKPGTPAPTIIELIRDGHAGARQTCAKALRSLEADGLLIRYPGLGYYVAARAADMPE